MELVEFIEKRNEYRKAKIFATEMRDRMVSEARTECDNRLTNLRRQMDEERARIRRQMDDAKALLRSIIDQRNRQCNEIINDALNEFQQAEREYLEQNPQVSLKDLYNH